MKYSSRFFLYAPLALFLMLAAGAGVYWWIAASALSARLDALNGHEATPGVILSFKSKSVSGFPFNLDVVLHDVRVQVATKHGPSSWTAENFALHALTYGREQMIFEAAGRQQFTWTELDGKPSAMPFDTGEMHASVIAGERGISRIDLDVIGFGSPALTAGRVQFHVRLAPNGNAIDIAAEADTVHLSPRLSSPLGDDITQVRLVASAAPPRPFDGLRAGRADWISALETWRAANGALSVSDLEIDWGKLSAMGKGSLTLDKTHSVQGLLDFKVAGINSLIEKANRRGLRGDTFRGLTPALLLRASQAGNNEAGLLGAVVEFNAGIVSLGGAPATTEEPLY